MKNQGVSCPKEISHFQVLSLKIGTGCSMEYLCPLPPPLGPAPTEKREHCKNTLVQYMDSADSGYSIRMPGSSRHHAGRIEHVLNVSVSHEELNHDILQDEGYMGAR